MSNYIPRTASPNTSGSGSGFAAAVMRDVKWCVDTITGILNNGVGGGSTGGAWFWGNGVPDDTLGKNGDLYLNVDTADVYGKANGTWL